MLRATGQNKLLPFVAFGALVWASGLAGAQPLPLAPGNSWTYQDAVTGSTFTVEVGASLIQFNGHEYFSLRGYTPERVYARYNEFGNLVAYNEELERDEMLTSFEFAHGAWFDAHRRECPEQGQVQEKPGKHEGPAGTWTTLDIHYRSFACADAGTVSEQYAANIGMVRRAIQTIAGPRTYDLVFARVGQQTISGRGTGGFSITAVANREAGKWVATLRTDLPLGESLELTFPSGQEYDARLRDATGRVVWTWSMDKLFAQFLHKVNVGDGWSATIEIPFPPAIPEAGHRYTLEAFLTNVQDEPQFAGATIVETVSISLSHSLRSRPGEGSER